MILNGEMNNELQEKRQDYAKMAKRDLKTNVITIEIIKRLEKVLDDCSLHVDNESGGTINKVMTGIYQADLFISKRFIKGDSTCIVSSNGDFALYVGEKLILLKDFHFDLKKKKKLLRLH